MYWKTIYNVIDIWGNEKKTKKHPLEGPIKTELGRHGQQMIWLQSSLLKCMAHTTTYVTYLALVAGNISYIGPEQMAKSYSWPWLNADSPGL
jgi:hypothetical protein